MLRGRTALVTGASRGIGAAIAVALAGAGADVVGVSSALATQEAVAESVRSAGGRYAARECDLADRGSLYRLLDRLEEAGEAAPDILVHAAGINRRAPAVAHGDELWDEVLAVNLTAPFILTRRIGAEMVARGSGKVIFLASVMTFQGGITIPGYAASKGGVGQLVKSLANEWASCGVNVNAIAPGYVNTNMNEALLLDADRHAKISERIPAGRWAEPSDIGGAAVFLASSAADYIHGVTLPVDGGWLGR